MCKKWKNFLSLKTTRSVINIAKKCEIGEKNMPQLNTATATKLATIGGVKTFMTKINMFIRSINTCIYYIHTTIIT